MFCVFLYRPFCHGAHKLDLSTLLTTFFSLNISSIYIILHVYMYPIFSRSWSSRPRTVASCSSSCARRSGERSSWRATEPPWRTGSGSCRTSSRTGTLSATSGHSRMNCGYVPLLYVIFYNNIRIYTSLNSHSLLSVLSDAVFSIIL